MSKIPELNLSKKGNELVSFYKLMVESGYQNDNLEIVDSQIQMDSGINFFKNDLYDDGGDSDLKDET